MSEIKRYDCTYLPAPVNGWQNWPVNDGDYVLYDDYKKLECENKELYKTLENVMEEFERIQDSTLASVCGYTWEQVACALKKERE